MKVKELIAELQKMPQDLNIVDADKYDINNVVLVDETRPSRLNPSRNVKCNWVVLE